MRFPNLFLVGFLLFATCACTVVKPYQRIYVDDAEMQLSKDYVRKFEEHFQDIREGAYPAGNAAQASGCGCN